MQIEPREAAPGALLRWMMQALQLVARGAGLWAGLSLLLCLAIFASQRLPLVGGLLSLIAFFSSIVVAAALDRPDPASASEVFAAVRRHGRRILLFAVIIATAGALIWMLALAKPGVPWWNAFYTERNIVRALSADWFVATRQIFVYSAYALGLSYFGLNLPGLTSFFQFACSTLLGLPFRDAYRAGTAAQMKNLLPMLGVGGLFILLPVATVLLLPPAVPLLYCFLAALSYVSFREIFLGRPDNRARERASQRADATVPSSGYSVRSASTGSSPAARCAGSTPAMRPISTAITSAASA